MVTNGYDFTRADLPTLQVQKYYPERTARESAVIRDWLNARGEEYDRLSFSVRVGQGIKPDPTHLIGVQGSTIWSTRKRIDVVAWQGTAPTLIEAKERIEPSALGQLLTYRKLWLEDNPNAPEPRLVVIGRYTDLDTITSLHAHGIDVFIYERPAPGG